MFKLSWMKARPFFLVIFFLSKWGIAMQQHSITVVIPEKAEETEAKVFEAKNIIPHSIYYSLEEKFFHEKKEREYSESKEKPAFRAEIFIKHPINFELDDFPGDSFVFESKDRCSLQIKYYINTKDRGFSVKPESVFNIRFKMQEKILSIFKILSPRACGNPFFFVGLYEEVSKFSKRAIYAPVLMKKSKDEKLSFKQAMNSLWCPQFLRAKIAVPISCEETSVHLFFKRGKKGGDVQKILLRTTFPGAKSRVFQELDLSKKLDKEKKD